MSSDAAHDADTLVSGDITTDMHGPSPQAATPGLLDDIVVTHILRSEYFDDPADLARLQSVSRAMRDAVAATGLRFEELDKEHAVELGCISAVKRMQWGGCLTQQEYLCEAAARTFRRVEDVARE